MTALLDLTQYQLRHETNFRNLPNLNGHQTRYIWSRDQIINNEAQYYIDPESAPAGQETLVLSASGLSLVARPTPNSLLAQVKGQPLISGMVTSHSVGYTQLFGYWEINAKLPSAKGAWPAFWLLPEHSQWPEGIAVLSEIDVMEAVSDVLSGVYHASMHTNESGTLVSSSNNGVGTGQDLVNEFHRYGLSWEEDEIVWYFDGREVKRRTTPEDMKDVARHYLLNLAVGGSWAGTPDLNDYPASFDVEYVRVYERGTDGGGEPLLPEEVDAVLIEVEDTLAEVLAMGGTVAQLQTAFDTLSHSADVVRDLRQRESGVDTGGDDNTGGEDTGGVDDPTGSTDPVDDDAGDTEPDTPEPVVDTTKSGTLNGVMYAIGVDILTAKENYRVAHGEEPRDTDLFADADGEPVWVSMSINYTGKSNPLLNAFENVEEESVPDTSVPVDKDYGEYVPGVALTGKANTRKVPRQLENTWRINSSSADSLVTFRDLDNKPRQVFAFFDLNARINIVIRDFPDGQWSDAVDIHDEVCGREREWDNHNYLAVGVCPQTKKIFVTGNHHSDPLQLAYSKKGGSIVDGWTDFDDKNIIGDDQFGRWTYPTMTTVGLGEDEALVLSMRDQKAGSGYSRFKASMMIWDHKSEKFTNVHLQTGLSLRLYVSNVARCEKTGGIHLSCIWRDETEGTSPDIWTKQDHWHMYSLDGKNWKQYKHGGGTVDVKLPLIWKGTSKAYKVGIDQLPAGYDVPVKIWDTGKGDPEPNSTNGQGSIRIDNSGRPHIMHSDRDTKSIWHTWYESGQWHEEKIGWSPNSEEPIPFENFAALVAHDDDEIWFIAMEDGYKQSDGIRLSKGGLNGSAGLSVDDGALSEGWLSYPVMKVKGESNDQNRNGSEPPTYLSDCTVVSFPLEGIKDAADFTIS